MLEWFVYILASTRRNWTYVGITKNIPRRLKEHNDGLVQSTKFYRPLRLVAYVAVETGAKARALERYLKVGSGKAFMKKRILTDEVPFSGT